jgi:hypothetical protein
LKSINSQFSSVQFLEYRLRIYELNMRLHRCCILMIIMIRHAFSKDGIVRIFTIIYIEQKIGLLVRKARKVKLIVKIS